jgi:hypothetical protein
MRTEPALTRSLQRISGERLGSIADARGPASLSSLDHEAPVKAVEHFGKICAKCGLAVVVTALFLAITLPNTGRVVLDRTTTPPTPHVVGSLRDTVVLIGIATVPLALVLIGTLRRSQLVIPGWILLAVLVLILFLK